MTIKSRITRRTLLSLGLLLSVIGLSLFVRYDRSADAAVPQDAPRRGTMPTRQNQPAIAYLKEIGLYGSVKAILDANRNEIQRQAAKGRLTPESFVNAVAFHEDTAIIGSFGDDSGNGAAFIFERNGNGEWSVVGKLVASDSAAGDYFGLSVAIHNDIAVVGASGADMSKGAAYIFERHWKGGGEWGEVKKLVASDGASGDGFGRFVALSGERAMIGSFGANFSNGAAYIYDRVGDGEWSQVKKLDISQDEASESTRPGFLMSGGATRSIENAGHLTMLTGARETLKTQSLVDSQAVEQSVPDPTKVYIDSVSYGGTGCAQGSVSQAFSNDRTSVTLLFDQNSAIVGPGVPVTEARKNCQLNINLRIPNGFSYSVATVDYKSYVNIPAGMTSEQKSTYYFQGEIRQASQGTRLVGPVATDHLLTDTLPLAGMVWMPCGRIVPININAQIQINPGGAPSTASGQIVSDTITNNVRHILGFMFQRC